MAAIDFPDSPSDGQQFITGSKTWRWNEDRLAWEAVKGGTEIIPGNDVPPVNPRIGDLWFDTSIGSLFYYLDDGDTEQWVDVSTGGGSFEDLVESDVWTSTYTTVESESGVWSSAGTTLSSNGSAPFVMIKDSGGDMRGNNAVDLQLQRTSNAEGLSAVASGIRSALVGGVGNAATGDNSIVVGGTSNIASGSYSAVVGGIGNTAQGNSAEVLGGSNSFATGTGSSTIGGNLLSAFGNYSATVGGDKVKIETTAKRSGALGGLQNTVSHDKSVILGGENITTSAINTAYAQNLHITSGFKMPTGASADYVLTTDANGVGTWQSAVTNLQTLYVSKDGDDANGGTNIGEPKLTISSAISAAQSEQTNGDPSYTIQVLDDGIYDEQIILTRSLNLYAPFATIAGQIKIGVDCHVKVNKHYWPTTSSVSENSLLLSEDTIYSTSTNIPNSYYESNLIDLREIDGTWAQYATAVKMDPLVNYNNNLHVKIGKMRISEQGKGLTTTSSTQFLYFDINSIELCETNAIGIYTGSDVTSGAQYIGKIGEIVSKGGINHIGIYVITSSNAIVNVKINKIFISGGSSAYSYRILDAFAGNPDSGELYIDCNNIRAGARQGTPAYENSDLSSSEQTTITNLAGTYATSEAAEAAMPDEGFYTWTENEVDGYKQLSFKDSTKVWHIKEVISDSLTLIVGGESGDDFTDPQQANRYLSHFDIAHNITVTVLIRPGTYTNQYAMMGHPHGERIFYMPFDAAAEPSSYPATTDFSTGTGNISTDETMLRNKYPIVIETVINDQGLRAASSKTLIFRNCLFIGATGTTKSGAYADEGGHIDCEGCTFFRFFNGVYADNGADIRTPRVAAAWCTNIGFHAVMNSQLRSSSNPGATIAWCAEGIDIYNSRCNIEHINIFQTTRTGIEVRHHSSFGENADINVTADHCNTDGDDVGVLHVRRNSYAKFSNVNITNSISTAIKCQGAAYIFLTTPAAIDTPTNGTSPAIWISSYSTIQASYSTPANFSNDMGPIQVGNTQVLPSATGNGDDYSYDGGVYGSILIT